MWLDVEEGYYGLSDENTICEDLTEFAKMNYRLILDGTKKVDVKHDPADWSAICA